MESKFLVGLQLCGEAVLSLELQCFLLLDFYLYSLLEV